MPRLCGPAHPNWKGGRYITDYGYVMIRPIPGRRVYEHRWVIEQHLGRPLERWEIIHHKNGNRSDNRIENLEILTQSEHAKLHAPPHFAHQKLIAKIPCPICGNPFKPIIQGKQKRQLTCSSTCGHILMHRRKRGRWRDYSPEKRDCEHCNKTYLVTAINRKTRFCSRSCAMHFRWTHNCYFKSIPFTLQ